MRNTLLTAKREFLATVMTKSFLFSILSPAIIGVVITVIVGFVIATREQPKLEGTIAIMDGAPGAFVSEGVRERFSPEAQQAANEVRQERISEGLESVDVPGASMAKGSIEQLAKGRIANVTIETLPYDGDLDAQKARLRSADEDVVAIVRVGEEVLQPSVPVLDADGAPEMDDDGEPVTERTSYELYVSPKLPRELNDKIRDAVEETIVDRRLSDVGYDAAQVKALTRTPEARTLTVTDSGESKGGELAQFIVPIGSLMLLWIAVMFSGQYLLSSTIEEKSSRVMEVLLSAVSPMELMAGKILGQGLVGLLVVIVYGGTSIFAAAQFDFLQNIPMWVYFWLVIYFLMAHFMIASIMGAIGAAVTELREAQAFMGPVMIAMIIPIYIAMFSVETPNSIANQVMSFIPPITPFLMIFRLGAASDPVPMWQIIATTIIGLIGVYVMVWASAKVFRVGVLMYGKPPSPLELLKWIRRA